MLKMISCSSDKENREIKNISSDTVAMLSDDKLSFIEATDINDIEGLIVKEDLIDLSAVDITKAGAINKVSHIRKKYKDMNLMVIADATISPMEYIRPDILASSLVIRPFTKEQLKTSLKAMIIDYVTKRSDEKAENTILVDTYDGKLRVPYNSILYIEAREKKLFACLKNKEYSFNGTLDELEVRLAAVFKRCHRGFLVNPIYIDQVFISKNEIHLSGGTIIPLSRSYKPQFKNF